MEAVRTMMIAMLALPAATALGLLVAVWPWTSLYDPRPTLRLLAALVVASALVVVLQVVLALFGALGTVPLLGLAWLVIAAAAVGFKAWGRKKGRGVGTPLARPTPLGLALGALTAGAYLFVAFVGTLVPPYGWDALVYHLTDVYHAATTGTLERFPFPRRHFYYPQVGELHSLWAYLLAGAGREAWRVAGIGLLPLGLTAGVAVRAATEGLALRAALPWIAAGMMLTPIVMIQPLAGYVDAAFAAFVLAAYAFAVLAAVEGRFAHLAFCALAGGLALGVKISFLYFSIPILLLLAGPHAWRGMLAGSPRLRLARLFLCAALFGAGSGYWLGRNLVETGNPIYPTRVRIAGVTLLEGPREIGASNRQQAWFVPKTVSWLRYPFFETFHGVPAYTLENGFGPLFAAGFLATGFALVLAARRKRWILLRALLALPITLVLYLTVNPYQEPRYVIASCGFALIGLAVVAEAVGRGPRRLVQGAATLAIVFAALGGVASAAPDLREVIGRWRAGRWRPADYYPLQYGVAGLAFNWLAANAGEGKTVTFTHPAFVAPLYGWHGRNRVVYASTSGNELAGRHPRCPTYRSWRRFLLERKVDWVVVWIPWWDGEEQSRGEAWVAEHPDDFTLVREFGGRARIYGPRFAEAELTALREPPIPDLEELDSARAWWLEYRQGTDTDLASDPDGGIRVHYEFETRENDYCDYRAELGEPDWSGFSNLSFDLEVLEPSPSLLILYLKDQDPRQACRFRIDLADLPAGRQRISLPLRSPDWKTGSFDLGGLRELHLVLDDGDDGAAPSGALRIAGFRVERSEALP